MDFASTLSFSCFWRFLCRELGTERICAFYSLYYYLLFIRRWVLLCLTVTTMGCKLSMRRKTNFHESIAVLQLQAAIDSNPTFIDESSNVVLRYRTPYFRATAQVQVPPVIHKEIWTVGWIQACNQMDFYNCYGEEGISSWELPELKDGHIQAISDSDGVNYPWYGSTTEIYTIVGPTKRSTMLTVSMNDNFSPSVTWSVPLGTTSSPPLLRSIQRDQRFTTWLVAMNETTAEIVLLRTIRWRMQLAIEVDPEKPLGQRSRLLGPLVQEPPEILGKNEPIPPNALVQPSANDAQVLVWRPSGGEPVVVIPPKYQHQHL